jgi:hypothetical protein
MNAKNAMTVFGLFSLLFFVSGCAARSNPFVGNTVSKAPVVVLQPGGSYADSWQTFDMKIDYEYKQDGDAFEITGHASLTQHYEMMYASLRNLRVYLFLLDDKMRVLESSLLVQDLTGRIDEKWEFTRALKLPQGATGLSFGYEGQAAEQRDISSFYLLPLK